MRRTVTHDGSTRALGDFPLAASTVRERLRRKEPLFGVWTSSSDVAMVAAVASAGFDYVVIDLQHGAATEAFLPGLCASIALTGALPIARARSGTFADVGRAPFDLEALTGELHRGRREPRGRMSGIGRHVTVRNYLHVVDHLEW